MTQTVLCQKSAELTRSKLPEEFDVTFQVLLTGTNGVLLGSDKRIVYSMPTPQGDGTINTTVQRLTGNKIIEGQDVYCSFAGGPNSRSIALALSQLQTRDYSDIEFNIHIENTTNKMAASTDMMDEILVIRKDNRSVCNVTKHGGSPCNTFFVTDKICTGDKSSARFIPNHFWRANMSLSELEALALVTLYYANLENQNGVGGGVDILTLDCAGEIMQKTYSEQEIVNMGELYHAKLVSALCLSR